MSPCFPASKPAIRLLEFVRTPARRVHHPHCSARRNHHSGVSCTTQRQRQIDCPWRPPIAMAQLYIGACHMAAVSLLFITIAWRVEKLWSLLSAFIASQADTAKLHCLNRGAAQYSAAFLFGIRLSCDESRSPSRSHLLLLRAHRKCVSWRVRQRVCAHGSRRRVTRNSATAGSHLC